MFLDDVPLPPLLEDDFDDVSQLGRAFNAGKSKFVEQVRKNGQQASGVRAYLAATAYADAQMGRALNVLERSVYARSHEVPSLRTRRQSCVIGLQTNY